MKTNISQWVNSLGWLIMVFLVVLVLSCQRDGFIAPFTSLERQQMEAAALDNGEILAAAHSVSDLTAGALAGQGITDGSGSPYGRATGSDLDCSPTIVHSFRLDRSHFDSLIFTGTLSLDFGNGEGCMDSTERRLGKINDHYVLIKVISTRAFQLTDSLSFEGFQKGDVMIDGTFIRTTSSALVSTLQITDARLTYPDGTFTTFAGHLTSTIIIGDQPAKNHCSAKEITGAISGMTRMGKVFSATIGDALVFKYGCFRKIPVSGTIDLMVGPTESKIDFGDGTCDKVYSITSDGVTITYSFDDHHEDEPEDTD